jgi:hypothetical protein
MTTSFGMVAGPGPGTPRRPKAPGARGQGRRSSGGGGADMTDPVSDVLAAGSLGLGRSQVTPIGYGAMQLAGDNVFGPPRDRAGEVPRGSLICLCSESVLL